MKKYGSCVLYKFMVLFRIASFFGAFPCSIKKGGNWKAKSPLFCRSSWCIWALIFTFGIIFSTWHEIEASKENFTFADFIKTYFRSVKNILEKITFSAPQVLVHVMGALLAWELGGYGAKLEYLTSKHFVNMPAHKSEARVWPLLQLVLV